MELARRTFVTGQPGCGKTTLVMAIARALIDAGVRCRGFYTEECLQGGRRIGFDVVTIPEGFRAPLARKGGPRGWPKVVGAYSVDLKSFEKLALPTLNPDSEHLRDVDVIICDEIGRMELKSAKFAKEMKALLARDEVHIFGAMTAPR
eukprot:jgi/Bigna1/43158/e_gw1.73.46.1